MKQLERLQEEYWFLTQYPSVKKGLEELEKEQVSLKEEKRLFFREKKAYQPILDEISYMKELKLEADLYKKEGYQEFYPAYETYTNLLKKYEDRGYYKEMLEKIDISFYTQEQILSKREQEIRKKSG